MLPYFKSYKPTVNKTVWNWWKKINIWSNGTEKAAKIDPYKYTQFLQNLKGNLMKKSLSTNSAQPVIHPCVKKMCMHRLSTKINSK